jgi:hypothetical protein
MTFLLLIIEPRGQRDTRTDAEGKQLYAQMVQFGEGLAARDQLVASESLRTDQRGVRAQVRDSKPVLHDGPFTEAKEMVGGFYLLDNVTQDEAITIASQCPAAQWATVEVREIAPCYAQ